MRFAQAFLLLCSDAVHALVTAEKPIYPQPTRRGAGAGQVAKLVLYPGSRIHPRDLIDLRQELQPCPDDGPSVEIALALDTCLSGEYYLQNNFKMALPLCDDGSMPTVKFYQRRRCAGEAITPKLPSIAGHGVLSACLWSQAQVPNPSYYWSLILRCGPGGSPEAPRQQDAVPPTIIRQMTAGTKGHMRLNNGILPCGDSMHTKPSGAYAAGRLPVVVDPCHWPLSHPPAPVTAVQVTMPAVCPNGTRARLARIKGLGADGSMRVCHGGRNITLDGELMDVNDDDIGRCISMREPNPAQGGAPSAEGVVFYCDGVDQSPEPPEFDREGHYLGLPPRAIVSHSSRPCGTGANLDPGNCRPMTVMEVETDTCVNLPPGQGLNVHDETSCADWSIALFAAWRGPGCRGAPRQVSQTPLAILGYWHKNAGRPRLGGGKADDDGDPASYTFWCKGSDGVLAAAAAHGRAVYTVDGCPVQIEINQETFNDPPSLILAAPDTCFDTVSGRAWKIVRNPACGDGRTPRLASWVGPSCSGGRPVSVEEVSVGKCMPTCAPGRLLSGRCSHAFWCDPVPVRLWSLNAVLTTKGRWILCAGAASVGSILLWFRRPLRRGWYLFLRQWRRMI